MKLFPCLTLAALCAAFAGCTPTKQTVSFRSYSGQTGVTVFVDGKEIGTTGSGPLSVEFQRPAGLVVYDVVCKKDGFVSDSFVMESAVDSDGLYSFFDDYPIPELMASDEPPAPPVGEPADDAAVAETPAPQSQETVAAVEEEPAPQPREDEEIAATAGAPAGEQGAVAAAGTAETVAVVDAPIKETPPKPVPAGTPGETAVAVAEPPQTPAVVTTAPEPQPPVSEPQPAPEAKKAALPLDPSRTLKDIENEINLLSQQRQNGQLSEKEFQKACEALEKEVRARYER